MRRGLEQAVNGLRNDFDDMVWTKSWRSFNDIQWTRGSKMLSIWFWFKEVTLWYSYTREVHKIVLYASWWTALRESSRIARDIAKHQIIAESIHKKGHKLTWSIRSCQRDISTMHITEGISSPLSIFLTKYLIQTARTTQFNVHRLNLGSVAGQIFPRSFSVRSAPIYQIRLPHASHWCFPRDRTLLGRSKAAHPTLSDDLQHV